jgi:2-polyprenyl-3-methyl-5-hydroxy-6-metoxy-1,4-benzoquinol methylase
MIGSQCCGIEDVFNESSATRSLNRYLQNGPKRTTRLLLDALIADGVEGATLLDIGGGIGAIQFELLNAGLDKVIGVEASGANVRVAKSEARRIGVAERAEHYHADFVEIQDQLPEADIVTMDRAICCYRNMSALIKHAAKHTRSQIGIVYPRDNWLNKLFAALLNAVLALRGSPFRVFVHATKAVDHLLRKQGLHLKFLRKTPSWQVVVYQR